MCGARCVIWNSGVVKSQQQYRAPLYWCGGFVGCGRKYRFGPFEAHTASRELFKGGTRIRLRGQHYLILEVLLDRAGEVVTRDQTRGKLWPADTFVDFEHGLNTSVKKLRRVLCDSAEKPRYIETLPRLGYRFIAPVEVVAETTEPPADAPLFSAEEMGQGILSAAGFDPENPSASEQPGGTAAKVARQLTTQVGGRGHHCHDGGR
jgi:DNA-binding winged helix-turn-helix (wHTH) protein